MDVKVLGYTGRIQKGSDGFYVNFDIWETGQSHWRTTGLIAQKYNILRRPGVVSSDIYWRALLKKEYNLGIVYDGHRFPEFEDMQGLKKFIELLNNNFEEDLHFINLDYIL